MKLKLFLEITIIERVTAFAKVMCAQTTLVSLAMSWAHVLWLMFSKQKRDGLMLSLCYQLYLNIIFT